MTPCVPPHQLEWMDLLTETIISDTAVEELNVVGEEHRGQDENTSCGNQPELSEEEVSYDQDLHAGGSTPGTDSQPQEGPSERGGLARC